MLFRETMVATVGKTLRKATPVRKHATISGSFASRVVLLRIASFSVEYSTSLDNTHRMRLMCKACSGLI